MDESKAQEILLALIQKPGADAASVPKVWGEIMGVYNAHFAPPAPPPPKKKRRGTKATGWPRGVSRQLWQEWKAKNPEGKMEEFLRWHNEAHSHMPERLHGNDLGHGPDGYQEPEHVVVTSATPPFPSNPDERFPLDC